MKENQTFFFVDKFSTDQKWHICEGIIQKLKHTDVFVMWEKCKLKERFNSREEAIVFFAVARPRNKLFSFANEEAVRTYCCKRAEDFDVFFIEILK